jgi:hypothetical protein
MILIYRSLLLGLVLLVQTSGNAPVPDNGLTNAENEQLRKEQKIDGRIKIYDKASTRIFKALQGEVRKDDFQAAPSTLKKWTALLDSAAQDIEARASRKKKSKALIRYEITLRKALSDVQGFKLQAPLDQQDTFDAFLKHAQEIRKGFVDILFPGAKL